VAAAVATAGRGVRRQRTGLGAPHQHLWGGAALAGGYHPARVVVTYWRAVHATPEARRPNAREKSDEMTHPTRPPCS
jgi:hypothetical protein